MKRALLALLCLPSLAWSQGEFGREAIEARYQSELKACAERFAVTACRDAARQRRQQALQPLLERERREAAAARAQQAQEQRERVLLKQQEAAAEEGRKRTEAVLGFQIEPASAPASAPRPTRANPETHARQLKARDAQAEQAAQQQREQAMLRQQRLRDHQALVQKRVAEHAAKKASGAPLPVPAASAIAALPPMPASAPGR